MRKNFAALLLVGALLSAGNRSTAQTKTGCISFNELLNAMPEFKKADTTLAEYRISLEQKFEAYQTEYAEQRNLLSSRDTPKYPPAQLDIKKRTLAEILGKLQGYEQEASTLLDQRRQVLLLPIQKKAAEAIRVVSKENGYAYVLEKDVLHVYPPSDDILPLVKKKLGL
jgi:outer membrane protein